MLSEKIRSLGHLVVKLVALEDSAQIALSGARIQRKNRVIEAWAIMYYIIIVYLCYYIYFFSSI